LVTLAFLVETAAGFGSMVVALTLGALLVDDIDFLLGLLIPVNLVLSVWLFTRGRRFVDFHFLLKRMIPPMGLGVLLGTLSANYFSGLHLKIAFGILVVVLSVWQLIALKKSNASQTPLPNFIRLSALFIAGIIHGIFGTGGPLAVFVSARELADKSAFRANLSALWILLNVMLLPRLIHKNLLTLESLSMSAVLLVPLIIGIFLGEAIHRRLEERQFRLVVSMLLTLAGSVLVVSSLLKTLQ